MMRLLRRLGYLVNKRRHEAELAEELDFHRAMTNDARVFGSRGLAINQSRDRWIAPWLQDAAQDVRFAIRLLGRNRPFTLAAAAILGLGIGVDNTLLMAVNAACLRGLPIAAADRVLFVGARDDKRNDVNLSYREYEEIRAATPAFATIGASTGAFVSVGDDSRAPDRANASYVSAGTFALLGEQPVLGRDFTEADDRPGAPPVAILGGALWRSRYAADPAIVGRTIRINGVPTMVVGVVKAGFRFPRFADLWLPLRQSPHLADDRRLARILTLYGRLRDHATIGDARGQIAQVSARLERDHPDTNRHTALVTEPINDRYNQRITEPSWIGFMLIGAMVLLIACANVANLLLMRSAERMQEFAIRASLGASRFRIVRQLLIECAALASVGGLAGWMLAVAGGRLLTSLVPESQMPFWIRFTMDGRMLLVLTVVTLATVFAFGLAPALHTARTDVNEVLKDGGRTTAGGRRMGSWTSILLAGEFALTVMLVTMLIKGERLARNAERAAAPYDATNVVTGSIQLPMDRYRGPGDRLAFLDQVETRLNAMPSIGAFSFATALPGAGPAETTVEIDGQPPGEPGKAPRAWTLTVGRRYFDTIGVSLRGGRPFSATDGSTGAGAAIVNQRFVEMFFTDRDPIGRRIRLLSTRDPSAAPAWLTIVGVAPTLQQRLTPTPDPIVYVPLRGAPPSSVVALVRGSSDMAGTASALRDVVRALNPDLPIARVMTMEQAIAEAQWAARGSTKISETVVLVAILLAAAGLYAVTAHAVVLRGAEFSVRRALGAGARDIAALVGRRAAMQVGIGSVVGIAGALVWARLSGAWLVEGGASVRFVDPVDLAAVVGVVAAVAAGACMVPTWRAIRLDPMQALRRQ